MEYIIKVEEITGDNSWEYRSIIEDYLWFNKIDEDILNTIDILGCYVAGRGAGWKEAKPGRRN